MPRLPGFIGGTYTPRSYRADVERTVNLVPEIIESKEGENAAWMERRPGLNIFAQGNGTQGDAIYCDPASGRTFAVLTDGAFVEINSDGTLTAQDTVSPPTASVPACIVGNGNGGHQLFITSGGDGYCFDLNTDTLAAVTVNLITGLVRCGFMDGYFLVLNDTGTFQWSALEDGTTWDALDVAQRSTMDDPWLAFAVLHREIRFFGAQSGEAWSDTGDALTPFALVPGSVNEQGIAAPNSLAVYQNTVIWIGRNTQGQGIVWQASGYIPQRVSIHPLENALAKSGQVALARQIVVQQQGHTFYLLRVPDVPTTWAFDLATTLWCEWAQLVDASSDPWVWRPFPAVASTLAFGRQLVLGTMTGYTVGTLDETGAASSDLLAVSTNAANLLIYDWGPFATRSPGTLRSTVTLTGTEGAGATAARPNSVDQAFASIRGGAALDIYAGASVTVPSASAAVGSTGPGPQWVRTYSGLGSTGLTYLVVAGGGGAGSPVNGGLTGGGGGGQVLTGTASVSIGAYPVVVGLGGAVGVTGSDSTWNGLTALGGGHGGAEQTAGAAGGNGGGAGNALFLGPGATSGDLGSGDWQSFPGGAGAVGGFNGGRDDINAAGGGAGAGGAGHQATQNTGGNGGDAKSSSISGAAALYGGGGGGRGLGTNGTGVASVAGQGGTNGPGAAGVVILRYPTGSVTATGGTVTTDGSDTIHTFTASGTFTVTSAPSLGSTWAVAQVQDVTTIDAGSFYLVGYGA